MRNLLARVIGQRGLVAACAALMIAACSEDGAGVRVAWLGEPVALGTQLLFVDSEGDRAWSVDIEHLKEEDPAPVEVVLPANPLAALPRLGESPELLIRTAGLRGVADGPKLVALAASGAQREYNLLAPYTALASSENGHYALAYFDRGSEGRAFAPAQLAVVDLERDDDDAVSEVGLEVDGAAPSQLWLTPALSVGGQTSQFALAAFARHVALLDLADPYAGPVVVTLAGDLEAALEVEQVVFLPEQGRIAFLARGADDVFVLTLDEASDGKRPFRLSVGQYAAGSEPLALSAPAHEADTGLVLLTEGGREVRSIDVRDGRSRKLRLSAAADTLVSCKSPCRQVLAYAHDRAALTLITPQALELEQPEAVQTIHLATNVSDVLLDAAHARAYLRHEDGALTSCALDGGTLFPIGAPASGLGTLQLAPDGALWFAQRGDYLIARFDPASRQTREVLLSGPLRSLVFVAAAGRAVVVHDEGELSVSVLDLTMPARTSAQRLRVGN